MPFNWLIRALLVGSILSALFTNAAIDNSNFVAPTAESPFRPASLQQQRAILPYSLYRRRLEEQRRASPQHLTSSATHHHQNESMEEDVNRPVLVYLPAFKNANRSQISEVEADALQSRSSMLGEGSSSSETLKNEVVSSSHDNAAQEKSAYSTNTRQPFSYHKSIFRPRTNQIVTVNEPRFQQPSNSGLLRSNPKPMSEKLVEPPSAIPERPSQPIPTFAKSPSFLNGISVVPSNAPMTQLGPGYQPRPIYSNLAPAPYNTLSAEPSSSNLIESIFSQSQTPVRYAPSSHAALAGQAAASPTLNPFQALANTASSLGVSGQDMLNPLQLLSGGGGSALEQISKLTRNLISMSGGNQELLSTLTKALSTNTVSEASKLTSNAVIQPASALASGATNLAGAVDKVAVPAAAAAAADTLFSSAKDEETTNASMKILSNLPEEQRSLLAAAIQNGEIDSANLAPTLGSPTKDKGLIKSDNRLLEWIQQNRPRAADREAAETASSTISADKLPYYGRYCGSFVEQANTTRRYNIAGALWAVDEHRLIILKFHFKPGARTENLTFWAGPDKVMGTAADVFPSENGFYLQPQPVDPGVFMNQQVEVITARIRNEVQKDVPASSNITAELEEMEEDPVATKSLSSNQLRRMRRQSVVATTVASVPLHFETSTNDTDQSVHVEITSPNADAKPSEEAKNASSEIAATNTDVSFGKEALANAQELVSSKGITALDWYAGFQPLLLTLPEGRSVRTLHWVSVFDHKRKESAAAVLIPNGVAFQIPASVKLRPLAPNGSYKVSSGAIKILDTKTIEIEDFSLETNGVPVWFLVGKEIVPHAEGQIIPVFDRATKEFDCDSLRDYRNETVTLRLPGTMDIKDVFWFSVFSITKSVSFSHIYVPYNDLHLPPDLIGVTTPRCVWKPKK